MKEKLQKFFRYKEMKAWYEKYERALIPAMLVLGVAVDFFTFTTINTTTAFLLLGAYLIIAGGAIIFLNAFDAENAAKKGNAARYAYLAAPLIMQFTFGALLSAVFIFYFFSGTIFVSWPFVGLIVILMISNEVFRDYYAKPSVQMAVFFFILFAFFSIVLPFAWKTTGVSVFLFSGAVSALAGAGFAALLIRMASKLRRNAPSFAVSIAAIFLLMNGLYFLNIIPPIPLAIRDAALSHDVKRINGKYALLIDKESFWSRFIPGQTFYKLQGGRVYLYTAIFAPEDLVANIVHHWQYYDEAKGEWVSRDRLSFSITGGAGKGYRGYSFKTNVEPGRWRVDVLTARGQTLGRVSFRIASAGEDQEFETLIK